MYDLGTLPAVSVAVRTHGRLAYVYWHTGIYTQRGKLFV